MVRMVPFYYLYARPPCRLKNICQILTLTKKQINVFHNYVSCVFPTSRNYKQISLHLSASEQLKEEDSNMLDVSTAPMDKFTSQDPSQIMADLSDFASKYRDEISARFAALQVTVEYYSRVDITNHVVSNVVGSMGPRNLAGSISEGSNAFQQAVAGFTQSVRNMIPVERIHELLASTFDVSAKLDQLKAIRIQDISAGKTIQDLTEFTDLSGAFETLKHRVASVLEPVARTVAYLELNQRFQELAQRF